MHNPLGNFLDVCFAKVSYIYFEGFAFCVILLLRLAATLTRRLETAERDLGVWDFGAEPFRLQKIAEHISPTDAGFICLLPCAPSPSVFDLQARRTRLFCLTSPLPVYMVG